MAINNSEGFRDWLENKPVEWVQVLATRIALRIFPSIADIFNQTGASQNAKEILFSSTTYALSISWVACRYSSHSIAPYATNAATYATAAAFTTTNAAPATNATNAAANAANTTFAANTTYDANATDAAAYTAKAADAANATNYAASGTWIGINADIEFLENSNDDLPTTVRNLAGKKLWLDNQYGNSTPNWASTSLRNLERNLTKLDENWRVWIDWYRQILQGKPGWGLSPKNAEQLIVRIATQENEFWDQGATLANAKIAKWLAELREEEKLNQLQPPKQALGANKAATGFVFENGKIDTVPPNAWENDLERAERIRKTALSIAEKLQEQFLKSNAEPHLATNISEGLEVLSRSISNIQPDELRLFAQSISATARVYGHPNAEWELGAETVENLFKFSAVLEDLQGIVKSDLQSNAADIRALDIAPENLAEAKLITDDTQFVLDNFNSLFSENASEVFQLASTVSNNAPTKSVQLQIEAERILLIENLALAIARAISSAKEAEEPTQESRTAAKDWPEFSKRFNKHFLENLPEDISDAIKREPYKAFGVGISTLTALGGTLAGILLALGPIASVSSVTAIWLIYEIRKKLRNRKKDRGEKS